MTLTAISEGDAKVNWGGACHAATGTTCVVTMDAKTNVTVNFKANIGKGNKPAR